MMKDFTFVTGNQNKADYLGRLIGLPVKHHKLDLAELQSLDLKAVVEHKARQAFEIMKTPALVEDVSLEFVALNKLPGTFIKFFEENIGLEPTAAILNGFSDRTAIAKCGYGYFEGKYFEYFEGSHKGTITTSIGKDQRGFGWDRIFIPDGYDGKVRSELSQEEYDELYLKIKPIQQLKQFLSE